MTGCPECGGAYEVAEDNGVTDPADGDRWELWKCVECGNEKTVTLEGAT